jgi:hypothetical protein
MSIRRQDILELQFLHHDQAGAIGERIGFVTIAKKRFASSLCAFHADPFPPQARTTLKLFPPGFCGSQTLTESESASSSHQ